MGQNVYNCLLLNVVLIDFNYIALHFYFNYIYYEILIRSERQLIMRTRQFNYTRVHVGRIRDDFKT